MSGERYRLHNIDQLKHEKLLLAIIGNPLTVVQVLVSEQGVDVNRSSKEGKRPLLVRRNRL